MQDWRPAPPLYYIVVAMGYNRWAAKLADGAFSSKMARVPDAGAKQSGEKVMIRIPEDHEADYKEYDLNDAKDMGWRMPKVHKMEMADGPDAAKNQISGLLVSMQTPVEDIVVTDESLENIVKDRNAALEQYISHILLTLCNPDEVWLVCHTGLKEYRKKYLKAFTDDETEVGFVSSVRKGSDGNILLMVFKCERWKDIDKHRRGALLYSSSWGKQVLTGLDTPG